MAQATIDQLIINSPYTEPAEHWQRDRATSLFERVAGRRLAGYVVATPGAPAHSDMGQFIEIPLVNQIRPRVQAWREAGYAGVTSITRRLLEHWRDPSEFESRRFFFCQLEAIETLIWLVEADPAERVGIHVEGDGGPFERLCCKMATGTGKTVVMAMLIAWQMLNKLHNPQDPRFARNVLVVSPGLTVKSRLQVLLPAAPDNYYQAFRIVPDALMERLRQGKVKVINWHKLAWDSAEQLARKHTVDKRGPLSDEAYARQALGDMASARNLLVINDEAHHAWRVNPEAAAKYLRQRDMKDSAEEATVWVGGLDRLHAKRGILKCYDFSATPLTPSGSRTTEEALYNWVISDFGLDDAIESGLVKTPRVVVRDDARPDAATYRSRLFHIYKDAEVQDDLNRKAGEKEPLPQLVAVAYYLLGYDWRETLRQWQREGRPTPPVMITVANRTETAARVAHAFASGNVDIEELAEAEGLLHIDSKVLAEAEAMDEALAAPDAASADDAESEDEELGVSRPLTKKEQAALLREKVDTVGRPGTVGENVRNVISVGMLSEGWDAKTVTHIMGLRAFSSQLLCEQVVGRGLRRTNYEVNADTGLYDPEYVNIFGVPFTFMPFEGGPAVLIPKPKTTHLVEVDPTKADYAIRWPNVSELRAVYLPVLKLDWSRVEPLTLNAADTPMVAELAPVISGVPDVTRIASIELEKLARGTRLQSIIFHAARDVFDQMQSDWPGRKELLLAQVVRIVEAFLRSDRIQISPPLFYQDPLRRRLIMMLNMSRIVQHLWDALRYESNERLEPIFDTERPIASSADMRPWYTSRPTELTSKSHVNRCVFDSTWEASDAYALDHHPDVAAWVKNDHLGFEIVYRYHGAVLKYRPDFLVRLSSGDTLVLETKGQDSEQNQVKRRTLREWTEAINGHGGFGRWHTAVAYQPGDIQDIIIRCMQFQARPKVRPSD